MHGRDQHFVWLRLRLRLLGTIVVAAVALALTSLGPRLPHAHAEGFCSPAAISLTEPGRSIQFTAVFIDSQGPMSIEVASSSPLISLVDEPNPPSNSRDDGSWSPNWNSLITLAVGADVADGLYELVVTDNAGETVCTVDVRVGAVVVGGDPVVILPPTTVADLVPPASEDDPAQSDDDDLLAESVTQPTEAPALPVGEVARPGGRSLIDGAIEDLAVVGRIMLLILGVGLAITGVAWIARMIVRKIRNREPAEWDTTGSTATELLDRPASGLPLIGEPSERRSRVRVLPDPPEAPVPLEPVRSVPSDPTPAPVRQPAAPDSPVGKAAEPEPSEGQADRIASSVDDLWNMDTFEPARLSERVAAVTNMPLDRTSFSDLPRPVRRSRRSAVRRAAQMRMLGGHRRVRGPSLMQRFRLSRAGRRYGRWAARPRIKGPTMVGRLRNSIAAEQRRTAPRWEPPERLADVVDVTLAARAGSEDQDPFEEKIG